MYEWYSMAWTDVVKKLNSDINSGLKLEQVEKLESLRSDNEILNFDSIKTSTIFFSQFKELWVIISVLNIILFAFLGYWFMFLFFAAIIAINLSIIALKKMKKEKELEELKKFDSNYAKVLRDGKFMKVSPQQLVIGDIVHLEKGDMIPADLRVIDSEGLKVDESAVTGEEYISEKYETKILDKDISLLEMKNILFKASRILAGSGEGIVISTGANTEIGKRIKILIDEKNKYTDFILKDINYVLNKLSIAAAAIGILAGGLLYFFYKNPYTSLEAFSIILMSLMPFSLMCTLYLSVKIIIKNFNKKNVVFKDLTAIKAFAEADLICVDKIGTLSKRKMKVRKIFTEDRFYNLDEENLEPSDNIERIVDIGVLSSYGSHSNKNSDSMLVLMEKTMKDLGLLTFKGKDDMEIVQKKIFNVPFDSELRIMTTINKIEDNYRANIKGSVDTLLTKCKYIMKNGFEKEIIEWDVGAIKRAEAIMTSSALNTLGFAYRNFSYEPSLSENIESNLVFVGLVGFDNEITGENYEAFEYLKDENINCMVFTEESKLVAYCAGKQSGIIGENQFVLNGEDIDKLKDREIKEFIGRVSMLSDITYHQKNKVIMMAQLENKVAVTGSKLTELPALKSASVGIGVGEGCSSIVRKLCDVWILDNSLSNIVSIKKNTYKILSSISNAVSYTFLCIIAQMLFITLALFCGYRNLNYFLIVILVNFPLTVINSIVIVLGYDQEDIREKAYLYQENVIRKNKWRKEILIGAFIAFLAFVWLKLITIAKAEVLGVLVLCIAETAFISIYRKFKKRKKT